MVFISETWWSDISATNITGFNLFRRDRDGRGGEVCIYIKDNINAYIIDDEFLNYAAIEQIWCIIEIGEEKVLCGCVYRTGSSSYTENLAIIRSLNQASCFYLKSKCSGILICGDFNYSSIYWYESYNVLHVENDLQANDFINCLNNCFFHQNIINPTFQVKLRTESNVIDLILTESENKVFSINHLPPLGGLVHGHHVISFNYWYLQEYKVQLFIGCK